MSAVTPLRLPALTLNSGVRSEIVDPFDGDRRRRRRKNDFRQHLEALGRRIGASVRAILGTRPPPIRARRKLVGQLERRARTGAWLDAATRKDDVLEGRVRCDVERVLQRPGAVAVCILEHQLDRLIPRPQLPILAWFEQVRLGDDNAFNRTRDRSGSAGWRFSLPGKRRG